MASPTSNDRRDDASPSNPLGDPAWLEWVDETRRAWQVGLQRGKVVLRGGDDVLEVAERAWNRDIYITEHGDGYIVRFETFDRGLVFTVSAAQAAPLLSHIGASAEAPPRETSDDRAETAGAPLLWPKVSPLAVWALISSSLVFVPVLGLLPAIVTVVLLVLHRARVRRTRAWGHSRAICVAATCFLVVGMIASALGTLGIEANKSRTVVRQPYGIAVTPSSGGIEGVYIESRDLHDRGRRSARTCAAVGRSCKVETSRGLKPAARGAVAIPVRAGNSAVLHGERVNSLPAALMQVGAGNSILGGDHNWGLVAAGLVVILLSLTVHEAGHAISAWWLGDDLGRRMGRVTLNPLAHVDPIGTIVLPFILFLADAGIFGWARPVPVRTEVLAKPRRGHILISMAGPGANLLLASASMSALMILGSAVGLVIPGALVENFVSFSFSRSVSASGFSMADAFAAVCTILKLGVVINVFLAFFNLIPIPPLDGSWVLENLFPRRLGPIYDAIRPYGFILFIGLMYTGVLRYLLIPAYMALTPCFVILEACTPFP